MNTLDTLSSGGTESDHFLLPERCNASFGLLFLYFHMFRGCIFSSQHWMWLFFFAAAVPVWTVLTLSKSRLTSSSASVFHGWFLLLSMCFLLIRIFPSLVWMSYYHCLSSWTCRNETITVTSPRRLRSVVALLFNNIDFWSLWNVSDVLWVWLWRGFSVLEVIISPWVAMTRVLLLPV